MNQINSEMDPLSSFEYPGYGVYNAPIMNTLPPPPYDFDVKLEQQPSVNSEYYNQFMNIPQDTSEKVLTNINTDTTNVTNDVPNTCNEAKQDKTETKTTNDISLINPLMKHVKKEKGRKSSYWSVKITDDDFKFYGCSVCDINFMTLQELDVHVLIHKDRVTSYDLKLKNLIKRKQKKKELKRMRKEKKVKSEVSQVPEIEIKPEDGYIGNEKATEYDSFPNQNNENQPSNTEDKKDIKLVENENGCNNTAQNLAKIYKCFACKKQFTLSYYLKLHVRSHTDEKPYTCAECGQSFITASKLSRHNKRIHLAIRFQCRICYRFFARFENLTVHFDKKHSEDKLEGEPYDYNAILPYLKELEDELKQKSQTEVKPNTDNLWDMIGEVIPQNEDPGQEKKSENLLAPKEEDSTKDDDKEVNTEVQIEEVKVDPPDIEIKKEVEDDSDMEGCETGVGDKDDSDDVKDEGNSDEDYFPSNTWAVSPKSESPPSPQKPKGNHPLKCSVCEKTVSTASYLRIHMRTHTGERPYKCYICNRGFITSSKMHRHVLTHEESWAADDEKGKKEGIKMDPDVEESTDTKALIKKAKAKFNKKAGKASVYKSRPHACEYCQKKFLHLETLQVHKKSHEGEMLVLKCNFCLEVMADSEALKQHEATHDGPKPYLCTICNKGYKKKETMVYHRKHHKSDREFICNICSKSFNAACKLQRHIVSHSTDKFVLRYECPVCAHMFHTKYHIQMHLSTHQKEGLIFEENRNEILAMVLQNARKIPKNNDGSSKLTELVPSDERSRVCNICGEMFQHFYYLEEHLKSHGSKIAVEDLNKDEIKKHVCEVCNKSFKLHYYLKLHSFTHTKEKPHICQQCGKGFITRGKLKRHLETHTGLKRYQCHICYKFFTRTSYLRIHVRTIHGTQDYNFHSNKVYNNLDMDIPMQDNL